MKVELLRTLKSGQTIWRKGLILDDQKAPFPDGILREIKAKAKTIRILDHDSEFNRIQDDDVIFTQETNKKLTKTDLFRMNKHDLISFINDEIKTDNQKRPELIKIAMEKLYDPR